MPQRPLPQPTKRDNIAGPDHTLQPGQRVEQRADGSVWLVTTGIKAETGSSKGVGADFSEKRIDSRQDRDAIVRGEIPWYMPYLERESKKEVKNG